MGVFKNILKGSASAWALSTFVKKSGDIMTGDLELNKLTASKRIVSGVNRQTLSANKTMASTDVQSQYLDPNGSNRDVTLYATPATGDYFIFKNIGSANSLVLKNNAGTTITTIGISIAVAVEYDGTEWQLV